jgi:hypothetical protein
MRSLLVALLVAFAAGCASLADRFERGNARMSTPAGLAYLVLMSPRLQQAMDLCMPPGTARPSPTLVLVADLDAAGAASNVRVEPSSEDSDCMREEFRRRGFPPPPLQPGEERYPVGLRIDLAA